MHSTVCGRVGVGGKGEAGIPPAAPPPYPARTYMLLYICTVHELCWRTIGEYRLRSLSMYSTVLDGTRPIVKSFSSEDTLALLR
jgi:hypothetical protein